MAQVAIARERIDDNEFTANPNKEQDVLLDKATIKHNPYI